MSNSPLPDAEKEVKSGATKASIARLKRDFPIKEKKSLGDKNKDYTKKIIVPAKNHKNYDGAGQPGELDFIRVKMVKIMEEFDGSHTVTFLNLPASPGILGGKGAEDYMALSDDKVQYYPLEAYLDAQKEAENEAKMEKAGKVK